MQVVKSYGQQFYLPRAMKPSRPDFYAKASLSSPVLCCKHHISMYLDKYLTQLTISEKMGTILPPQISKSPGIHMQYFQHTLFCEVH